ncbi:hypothetical protein GP486_003752 [Trichoglossum hirsutum]|uniref:Uncharacterized protein n=1 Tax=Trichoglossum hirsutum TaxID=265104 RepID=A0A9P8LCG5_9PEZI|nr:hypothetical protein GP486_003752 [Trichoglossum hirsutum]
MGGLILQMLQPGEQILHRGGGYDKLNKWMHLLDDVMSVMFVVDLCSYDQTNPEQPTTSLLMESLALFEWVANSPWFVRTSIILLFNNIGRFKQKLPKEPLQNYLPNYSGGNDVNEVMDYILSHFNQRNRAHRLLFAHFTDLADTDTLKLVIAAVKETIINNALLDSGIER